MRAIAALTCVVLACGQATAQQAYPDLRPAADQEQTVFLQADDDAANFGTHGSDLDYADYQDESEAEKEGEEPATAGEAAETAGKAKMWGQCGGWSWHGPTQCAAGSQCVKRSNSYSQCVPKDAALVDKASEDEAVDTRGEEGAAKQKQEEAFLAGQLAAAKWAGLVQTIPKGFEKLIPEEEPPLEVGGAMLKALDKATCFKAFLEPANEQAAASAAFAHVVVGGSEGEGFVFAKFAWWYLPHVTAAAPVIGMHIHIGDSRTNGDIIVGFCGQDPLPSFGKTCSQATFLQNYEVFGQAFPGAVEALTVKSETYRGFYLQLHLAPGGAQGLARGQLQEVPCRR